MGVIEINGFRALPGQLFELDTMVAELPPVEEEDIMPDVPVGDIN